MIQPLFEHRMTLAGFKTRVLELEGDGPPILMFHGYADSADTWRQSLALLGRRGHRAVAVDLPGFGQADPLKAEPILPQFDAFASAALRYAAGSHHDRVIVTGNSLGGCVSLRLAERCGDRLAGVMPVAPAGLEMSRLVYLAERDPILRTVLILPVPVSRALLRATVARLYRTLAFAMPDAVEKAVVLAFTAHLSDRATVARILNTGHRLLQELHEPYELARISVPVVVVWGDRDRLVFHRGAEQILATVPGARLELLPGIGHCPQVEAPERFTELLLEFCSEPESVTA